MDIQLTEEQKDILKGKICPIATYRANTKVVLRFTARITG